MFKEIDEFRKSIKDLANTVKDYRIKVSQMEADMKKVDARVETLSRLVKVLRSGRSKDAK